jgi:hypothetical protein
LGSVHELERHAQQAELRANDALHASHRQTSKAEGKTKKAAHSGAYLYDTDLRGAYLSGADLSDAEGRFESGTRMIRTRLEDAHLDGADLTNARVSEEQLRGAESLEGATMPDGQKYEDWLRSWAQLTAFFTSSPILASSAAVNSFSAKVVGHMAPSSRFAWSLKPSVAYLELNFCALWKKQTTLPSLAYAGIPYQVFGERTGALALMISWSRSPMVRSGSDISAIFASTSLSLASAFSSWARAFIAARSSSVNPLDLSVMVTPLVVVGH